MPCCLVYYWIILPYYTLKINKLKGGKSLFGWNSKVLDIFIKWRGVASRNAQFKGVTSLKGREPLICRVAYQTYLVLKRHLWWVQEVASLRDLNSIIGIALTHSKTIRSQVSVLKTQRLQLVPGSWGKRGRPRTFLHLAQWASVQRRERTAAADHCERPPAASSILADKTAAARDGWGMRGNMILKDTRKHSDESDCHGQRCPRQSSALRFSVGMKFIEICNWIPNMLNNHACQWC